MKLFLNLKIRDPRDAEDYSAILIALGALLGENQIATVQVFLMNNLVSGYRTREAGRGFKADDRYAPMNQYFSNSASALNDRSFVSDARVTLQLRSFDLGTEKRGAAKADIKDVAWYGLHVPEILKKSLVIEERL